VAGDFQPDVCVGSSLGAALLLELLRLGVWRGPAIMVRGQAGSDFRL
jgi:hypothetical protein